MNYKHGHKRWPLGLLMASSLAACTAGAGLDTSNAGAECGHSPAQMLYGLNIGTFEHRSRPEFHLDTNGFRDLGARWVRLEVVRHAAQPSSAGIPGCVERHPNDPALCTMASYYGESIRILHEQGMSVLLIVDYSSVTKGISELVDNNVYANRRTAEYRDSAGWQDYVQSFEAEIQRFAAELDELPDAWEVWNEPDQYEPVAYGTSGSGVPPQYFEGLLAGAARAIRSVDPGAYMVSGGVSSGNPGYLSDVVNSPAVPGNVLTSYNGLGVHVYRGGWSADMSGYLRESTRRNHLNAAGVTLPVWLTEAGATGANENAQGQQDFLASLYDIVAADTGAGIPWGPAFFFGYDDSVGGEGEFFGLRDASGNRRPAYEEYQRRAGSYEQCEAAGSSSPSTPPAPQPPTPTPTGEIPVCQGGQQALLVDAVDGLFMRPVPNSSESLQIMPCGASVTVHGTSTSDPNWLIVEYAGQCGFAHASYLGLAAECQ